MSNSLKKCSLQQPSDPAHKDAKGDNFIQATLGKLRQTSPTLAKAATFAATTGTIAANSSLLSVPLWGMGLVKTFTGYAKDQLVDAQQFKQLWNQHL